MKTYPKLTNRQKSIILGTSLGDGHLALRHSSARHASLSLVHGNKQADYLQWKRTELLPLFTSKTVIVSHPPHRLGDRIIPGGISHRARSRSHPFLTEVYRELYLGGRKSITRSCLEQLDPLAIAVWYMDDGCLASPYPHLYNVVLSTNCFSEEENRLIAEYFSGVHQIRFGLRHQRGSVMLASTDRLSITRFVNLVKDHIHPLFNYKVAVDYRS